MPVVFLDQIEPGMVCKRELNSSIATEKTGMAIDESHGELYESRYPSRYKIFIPLGKRHMGFMNL